MSPLSSTSIIPIRVNAAGVGFSSNNGADFDGSYLYRNPSDISYGGPLTLAVEDALETRCHAVGYDLTM